MNPQQSDPDIRPNQDRQANGNPRRRRARGWIINLLIIMAIYIGLQWYKARPLATGDAPSLRADLTTAEAFNLADWRDGPVLVHFWATWCPVCKLEEASIDALSDDFNVITVAMQSGGPADINAYLHERNLDFATIADPYGEIATAWGVRAVPASFVLDAEGQIQFGTVGYSTGIGLRGRLWAAEQVKPRNGG